MKLLVLLVCAFLVCLCVGLEDLGEYGPYIEGVPELRLDNFDQTIGSHRVSIVVFYAPWCGACKKFAPELKKSYQELSESGIPSFTFNAWDLKHKALIDKYNVSGYPLILLFREGGSKEYHLDRNSETFIATMKRWSLPPLQTFTGEVPPSQYGHSSVIGAFAEGSAELDKFKEVAHKYRDYDHFYICTENCDSYKLFSDNKVTSSSALVFVRNFDPKVVAAEHPPAEKIEELVLSYRFPIIGEISKANSQLYIDYGFLGFLFVSSQEQRTNLIVELDEVLTAVKSKIQFVFVDWEKYGSQAGKMGLSGQKVPALALENTRKQLKWTFDESTEINAKNVESFLNAVLSETLPPTYISQAIPESNNGPVKVIVGNQFQELVLDSPKDVFVDYYAPWCGHCKKLEPIWEELAITLKDIPDISIAKIDGTLNDVKHLFGSANAFPTLKLFKANDKKNPILFTSKDRSLPALLQFLKENSSFKDSIPVDKIKDEL